MATWDDVSAPVATPQASDGWDAVSSPASPPKLPDLSGVQKLAQDNLSVVSEKTTDDGSQKIPQTQSQRLDVSAGMPVSNTLKGNPTPLNEDTRTHLIGAYKDGTATNAADFMQSALPAIANTASSAPEPSYKDVVQQAFIHSFRKNLEATKQGIQLAQGQEPQQGQESDVMQKYLTSPYTKYLTLPDFKKIIGKTIYGITESSPEIGGSIAGGIAGVAAVGGPEDPLSLVSGPLAAGVGAAGVHYLKALAPTYAEELKAAGGDQERAWSATKTKVGIESAGTGTSFALFGYAPFEGAIKNLMFQTFAAQPAVGATQQAATNIVEGKPLAENVGQAATEAGAGVGVPLTAHVLMKAASGAIPGHEALKETVGTAIGKPAQEVTTDDINQTIAKGFAKSAPNAQDFQDAAMIITEQSNKTEFSTSSDFTEVSSMTDLLHTIYKETGVHPDQVFEDAKNNPAIAADIERGKVPKAYDLLMDKRPPIPPHIQDAMDYVEAANSAKQKDIDTPAPDETEKSKEGKTVATNPLSEIFNPAGMSEASRDMATALRQGRGPQNRDIAVIQDALEKHAKTFAEMSDEDRLKFISYMENRSQGAKLDTPELQEAADKIRDIYAQMGQKIQEHFPDVGLRKDYFTHQFEDQAAADKFFSDFVAQQGSEKNLQRRAFPTLAEAMDAGLKPKTTNPIETVMNYVRNMGNLIAAHRSLELTREGGIADYFNKGQQPEGWVPLNGNLAEEGGKILYAPEDAARVYNNDISEGITGPVGKILDNIQRMNNFANKLVLGLSGYHFTATTMASMSNDVGRALTNGSVPERIADIGKAVMPLSAVKRGSQYTDAYLGREELSPELQKALDIAVRNNTVNVKQQDYWKAGPAKDYVDVFKNGSVGSEVRTAAETIKQRPLIGPIKVIANELGRTMDTVAKPLFDYYIPRIKIAANIDELHDWLQSHPDATPHEQDRAAQDIGNKVDNAFGEMMRENLFWHQITRQTLQMGLLSYSWVTGAARMLKGIPDTAQYIMNGKELSSSARYLMGMAATYAVVNGVRTYLGTGHPPDDWKDFLYPRTGGTTSQGKEERELLPSHIGQYTNYLHEGIGELGNEASPGLKLIYHLLANQDWRGLPITNENNSWFGEQRWSDYIHYVLGEETPIGLKNFLQGDKKGSKIGFVEKLLGARQAPRFISDSEGYDAMMKRVNDKEYKHKLKSDKKLQAQYEGDSENP